jgi:2-keto-3-deoxy-L-rhamnonate aldolase RhmA
MYEPNPILELMAQKKIPLGMQVFTAHPAMIEILGATGYDFIMIDSEHSPNNARQMEDAIRTADSVGLFSFVRVSKHEDDADIHRALEAGAGGVFLPLVKSADDIRRAADAAFFPPKGKRGVCPSFRAARYNWRSFEKYVEWNNNNALLVPMIERVEAVENIEEICALDDVKIIVFAPGDLAYALGEKTGMMRGPIIQEAYRKVLAAAKKHGVAVMGGPVLDPTVPACRKAIDDGITIFCLGLDTMAFRAWCETTVGVLNTSLEGTEFSRTPAPESGFPDRI